MLTKTCPVCGRALAKRVNRENGSEFLGCTGYPDCKHTEKIPETLKMMELVDSGVISPLPGFLPGKKGE